MVFPGWRDRIAELDALIAACPQGAVLLVPGKDWFALDAQDGPHLKRQPSGALVYRGLRVWVRDGQDAAVVGRDHFLAHDPAHGE